MNLIALPLGLAILLVLLAQAVVFHKATVCRQEAWLKSTELVTNSLLINSAPLKRDWHLGCRIHLVRQHNLVTWQKLPDLKKVPFHLTLKGHL